jgi:hypothetical protein
VGANQLLAVKLSGALGQLPSASSASMPMARNNCSSLAPKEVRKWMMRCGSSLVFCLVNQGDRGFCRRLSLQTAPTHSTQTAKGWQCQLFGSPGCAVSASRSSWKSFRGRPTELRRRQKVFRKSFIAADHTL